MKKRLAALGNQLQDKLRMTLEGIHHFPPFFLLFLFENLLVTLGNQLQDKIRMALTETLEGTS